MVLQVFANKLSPVWHASLDHAYLVYGNPGQGGIVSRGRMNNDRAGFDSARGGFHLMTMHEAQTLSELLIVHAYVRFEDTVYHPTTGIPMGINPAVYYANLYLLSFELDFLQQFLPLLRVGRNMPAVPMYPGAMTEIVDRMVACTTAAVYGQPVDFAPLVTNKKKQQICRVRLTYAMRRLSCWTRFAG
jgi:hypothetical protein